MSTTLTTPRQQATQHRERRRNPNRNPARGRPNLLGGLAGWLWLAIVVIPICWILITSLKLQSNYYASNPLLPPGDPTLDNFLFVIESDFVGYFINSVVVTAGAVVPAVLVSFMAAYAIVRGWRLRFRRMANGLFLMGLAIPLQATGIPRYLIMIRLRLHDSLLALILPTIAFAIPLSVLVLANFIRDVPKELFEAMRIDGATEWGTLWRLAATHPAGEHHRHHPQRVLTTLPVLVLYVFGRRQLLTGLAAGFGGSR
jgi:raffinose/stachyose/melibiose transport system permease protein